MRFLFMTQYFPPDIEVGGSRVRDLALQLCQDGHTVHVITGLPHYPAGVVHPAYRGRFRVEESMDGVHITRTYVYATHAKDVLSRLLNYFSFMLSSFLSVLHVARHSDIVICTSPPLMAGISALIGAKICRKPFVFEVRDLWPEAAVKVGVLKSQLMITLGEYLEAFLYKYADEIVVVTKGLGRRLMEKGVPTKKLHVIPNGADVTLFSPKVKENAIRSELGGPDDFVVMYTGTFGVVHGMEVILEAARRLKDNPCIRFVLVGDGVERTRLLQLQQEWDLTNVKFIPIQPKEAIPQFISAGDVCVVTIRGLELTKIALPAKMFEYMACGRPVVLAGAGEAADLLAEADAGTSVPPGDAEALAQAILDLMRHRDRCRQMGVNGRQFIMKWHSRQALTAAWTRLLNGVVGA